MGFCYTTIVLDSITNYTMELFTIATFLTLFVVYRIVISPNVSTSLKTKLDNGEKCCSNEENEATNVINKTTEGSFNFVFNSVQTKENMKSGSNRTRKKNRVKKSTKRATRDTRWLNYQTFITKLDFGDIRYSDSFPSQICTHCKVSCYSAFSVSDKVCYDDLTLCQRCALYNGGNNLDDRISDLPDELLCYILSFLPMKLAFTTTVLSKRWTLLCCSLLVLRLNDQTFKDYEAFYQFCRFMDTLMLSPLTTSQPIKAFLLNCCIKHRAQNSKFNVTKWLEVAKRRRVEEFHLTLYYHNLKPIIFISQTLVVLKLKRLNVGNDTLCVDLPSLKTLYLQLVYFKNQKDYINFLSACPILEDFHAKSIYIHSEMNHDEYDAPKGLKSLTLSKLIRARISSMDVLFNGINNVEFLRITTESRNQEASFKVIPVFPNLIHIDLVFCHHSFHCWDGVVELLRCCSKLQILSIRKVC
ncbi:F-box/RNI/FBD-like domain protein [Medicago truncatula]|uniref:F-box/RNI/FBD-like domain protein n=1 Tax=Medicago truncatula TaxID=3880 RepID=A0A072VNY5_MEDTR|nr:F-box/RNI/FBD-like domain protein [Medicago truncatula]